MLPCVQLASLWRCWVWLPGINEAACAHTCWKMHALHAIALKWCRQLCTNCWQRHRLPHYIQIRRALQQLWPFKVWRLTFNYSIPNRQFCVVLKLLQQFRNPPQRLPPAAGRHRRRRLRHHLRRSPFLRPFFLNVKPPPQPGELLFQASGAGSRLPIDAVESAFAYHRLQMSARNKCEQSELCCSALMRMLHEFHLLWLRLWLGAPGMRLLHVSDVSSVHLTVRSHWNHVAPSTAYSKAAAPLAFLTSALGISDMKSCILRKSWRDQSKRSAGLGSRHRAKHRNWPQTQPLWDARREPASVHRSSHENTNSCDAGNHTRKPVAVDPAGPWQQRRGMSGNHGALGWWTVWDIRMLYVWFPIENILPDLKDTLLFTILVWIMKCVSAVWQKTLCSLRAGRRSHGWLQPGSRWDRWSPLPRQEIRIHLRLTISETHYRLFRGNQTNKQAKGRGQRSWVSL